MTPGQACPVVVLTGGIGSGKSTAAGYFKALGIEIVDADAIVHELIGPGGAALPPLKALLTADCFSQVSGLDRVKVREAVFTDPELRKRLEGVLHPMVQAIAQQKFGEATGSYCLYVVPLWAENYGHKPRPDWVWRVVVVDIDEKEQRRRVLNRTPMIKETLDGILAAQSTRQARLALADHTLNNDSDALHLSLQVQRLHADLIHQLENSFAIRPEQSKPMADRP